MIRILIGVSLLAASWLVGLGYYHEPDTLSWLLLVALGTIALGALIPSIPPIEGCIAAALLLPAAWVAPWPYKIAMLLLLAGFVALAAPHTPRWLRWLGSALLSSGLVLLAQGLAMLGYEIVTSRSHDVAAPLAGLLAAVARVMDIDAGAAGSTIAIGSMRKNQPLAATWALLLDPVTVSFFAGAALALWLRAHALARERLRTWSRAMGMLLLAIAAWIPLRVALLLGLLLHRTLLVEYDEVLIVNNQFFNTWLHLMLMGGVVFLAWRFIHWPDPSLVAPRLPAAPPAPPTRSIRQPILVAALGTLGVALISLGLFWDPAGTSKPGRVLVDEFHSKWEPTTRPMDTNWYGQMSGYNYACVYDYCSRFYDMSRNTAQPIDSATLTDCDVLIIKCPTSRYSAEEIKAIEQFVQRGGGLLLVGEHTDVFGTGMNLNDIAERFDFHFRSDCLFGIDSVFDDHFDPPLVPHPVIQSMGPLEFAVSCSIEPQGAGRAVIRGVGLKNMPADYHASNFYPQVEDRAESRYGAFTQCWATRHGDGRVLGFTDSTIWSNFCAFEPGKIELLLGLIEWLNHRNHLPDPQWWLLALGALSLIAGALYKVRWRIGWVAPLAAGIFAWSITVPLVRAEQRHAMPLPQPRRPMKMVAMDQLACSVKLPKDGFIGGKPGEFGIFERWILRLGYFTCRRSGADAFAADLVVFANPDRPVTPAYVAQLRDYVNRGGHILVLDSAKNTKSTANTLLYPFGLAIKHSAAFEGPLLTPDAPAVPATDACEVTGGEATSKINQTTVAATTHLGKGSVTAIGFSERFTDLSMGVTGDTDPDENMRKVYELQFQLLRHILAPSREEPTSAR